MNPRVSIIMPCFNAASHLAGSIGSIRQQDFEDWELIAVDDGSTDGTPGVLEGLTDTRIRVLTQANAGVSAARNAGLKLARGQFVAFLDSDDTWSPSFLSKMTDALLGSTDIGLVYCGWQNVGLDGTRSAHFVPPNYEGPNKQMSLLEGTRWPIHSCMTRRELVLGAGGFNTRFAVAEDFLLWLEIGCFHPIQLLPEVLAQYIHHRGVRATRDQVRAARQLRDAQLDFLSRHPQIATNLGHRRVREVTAGVMLRRAYEAYWRRDLETAQSIFRMLLPQGGWKTKDLRYLLPALLPPMLYGRLIRSRDN